MKTICVVMCLMSFAKWIVNVVMVIVETDTFFVHVSVSVLSCKNLSNRFSSRVSFKSLSTTPSLFFSSSWVINLNGHEVTLRAVLEMKFVCSCTHIVKEQRLRTPQASCVFEDCTCKLLIKFFFFFGIWQFCQVGISFHEEPLTFMRTFYRTKVFFIV